MNQWEYDQKVRSIAQSGWVSCPEDFSEWLKELCAGLSEDEPKKKTAFYRKRKFWWGA